MKVEAVRDDGALLITDGTDDEDTAAAIVSDDGLWVTLKHSALARGDWTANNRDLPESLPKDLAARLAQKRRETEARNPTVKRLPTRA